MTRLPDLSAPPRLLPAGMTPPVKIRAAWPAPTALVNGRPAATSPITRSSTGAVATSDARAASTTMFQSAFMESTKVGSIRWIIQQKRGGN